MNLLTARRLADYLNELVAIDGDALGKLLETRLEVNAAMAAHPTVIVTTDNPPRLGLLGLLNGLIDVTQERVMMQVVDGRRVFHVITPETHPQVFGT